jgi:hypothetical protein
VAQINSNNNRGDAIEAEQLRRASIRSQREFHITYAPTIGDV